MVWLYHPNHIVIRMKETRLSTWSSKDKNGKWIKDNYFDLLPIELQEYILSLRLREMALNNWYNYIGKQMVAVAEIIKYSNTAPRCNGHTYFDPMDPFVAKLTKYCAKILSGNEDEWWIGFLIRIRRGLVLTQYEGGPGAVYYSDTELYYQNLVNKFALSRREKMDDNTLQLLINY